jgi:hypothetical protein
VNARREKEVSMPATLLDAQKISRRCGDRTVPDGVNVRIDAGSLVVATHDRRLAEGLRLDREIAPVIRCQSR